jgi:hypothetical protein
MTDDKSAYAGRSEVSERIGDLARTYNSVRLHRRLPRPRHRYRSELNVTNK